MSSTEQAEEVIATIPGWQDASIRVLPGGLTNRNYIVETEGRRGVLKFDPAPRSSPLNTRNDEAVVQKQGARFGLANEVLYVDETTYLVEYVDGDVWTPQHFDVDANLLRELAAFAAGKWRHEEEGERCTSINIGALVKLLGARRERRDES